MHVQWLALPRLDIRWLQRVATGPADRVHRASRVAARRGRPRRRAASGLRHRAARGRALTAARRRPRGAGRRTERIAYIPHPVFDFDAPAEPEPPAGSTLLFFGSDPRLQGSRRARARARGAAGGAARRRGRPARFRRAGAGARARARVDGRIEWRLGFLPDDEVARLMAERDARRPARTCGRTRRACSRRRSATGAPSSSATSGSLGETVREFGLGEVAPPGDAHALAEACRRLLSDPARCAPRSRARAPRARR